MAAVRTGPRDASARAAPGIHHPMHAAAMIAAIDHALIVRPSLGCGHAGAGCRAFRPGARGLD